MENRCSPPIGVQANAWSNAATGANGQSAALDTFSCPHVSAFGNASSATTITLMLSMDNINWYAGPTVVLAGAGNFYLTANIAARYIALQSTNNVTVTATLAAKP
jgi:hypothetical protein